MKPYLYHHILQQGTHDAADNIALIHHKGQYSYRELMGQCERLLQQLSRLSSELAPQERVVLYLPKSPLLICAINAISRLGGIFVPIHPNLKPDQIEHILNDCQPRLLLTTSERFMRLQPMLTSLHHPLTVAHTPITTMVIDLIWVAYADPLIKHSNHNLLPATENDPVAILYTSGSTGLAKGVVLSHRNLIAGMESVIDYLKVSSNDQILALLPLSFDYGLNQVAISFATGATLILHDHIITKDTLAKLGQYKITILAGTPTLWMQLLEIEWCSYDLSHLRLITNSGGKLSNNVIREVRHRIPATEMVLMYGLTEAFRSTYLPYQLLDKKMGSIGIPIPNAALKVINEEGDSCQPHEIGELVHLGPLVAMGYWNRPVENAQRFSHISIGGHTSPSLPMVRSGDKVYRDGDGVFFFVGRIDDQIKSAEYRISPTEIESICMQELPTIEAIALGVPHPKLGEAIVVVYQIVVSGARVEPESLATICRNHLPNYMQPLHIAKAEQLATTLNGKVDRQALKQQFSQLFNERNGK